MYPKRVSRVRISLSPQNDERQLVAKATGCFWFRARRKLAFVRDRNRKQTSGRQAAAAVPSSCKAPRGGHRDSDGLRPAESRPLLPVGWKSLIQSKLRLVDHTNSTGLFLVTLLLSVTSILGSGQVLLSDLFFNKTTSSSDSSWSCLGHLAGESKLFI